MFLIIMEYRFFEWLFPSANLEEFYPIKTKLAFSHYDTYAEISGQLGPTS